MKLLRFIGAILVGQMLALTSFGQDAGDNPCNATPLTVGTSCNYTTWSNANATASAGIPAPGCGNYLGADVWFSAVVPPSGVLIIDSNTGVITDGAMALYTGTCTSLTLAVCDDDGSANGLMPSISQTGLTPGSTVYIRFWDPGNNNNGTFQICAKAGFPCTTQLANSSCASADPICTGVSTDYCNTTGVPSLGGGGIYGCLLSTPNPAFYFFQVAQSGPINFTISQVTNANVGIDVDYVLWGPFASQSAMCSGISASNIVSCSYSTAPIETASIANAISGQFYMMLITNYSNQSGVINFNQTNSNVAGAGTTNCNILTAVPSACSGGNYTLTGTLTVPSPPTTGTLTVSNSCGSSTVLNAPFASPITYTLSTPLCGNGASCSVSAVFSAAGAPVINPTPYTAPSCATLSATPGACSAGTYVMSGTLNIGCPPSTGTLTITSSCGGSVTLNAPFTSPINWSLPPRAGTGASCTISAVFSAAGAPIVTPITVTEPTCCNASTGTQNVTVTGGGVVTTLANGTRQVALCPGGSVSINSNNDFTLPPAGCATCTPGLMYAIYNQNGPSGPDPDVDPNWTSYYWTGNNFPGSNTGGLNTNTNGACSAILNLDPDPLYASPNSPTNTLVFVPITGDARNLPTHDNNNDGCYNLGTPISITYLNPIAFTVTGSCNGNMSVQIRGGYPEFLGGLYTITNTGSGAVSSTQVASGGTLSINGLSNGQTVSFNVTDATGCVSTFSQTYTAQTSPTITITPAASNICSGCVNLNATVTSGVASGTTSFSNSYCYQIPDAGISSTNTGQLNVGSWAVSPITVSGFCGSTWQTGNYLRVCINSIVHTWTYDLNIFLQAPNGVIWSLSQDHGNPSNYTNYTNTCFTATATNIIGTSGNNAAPFTGTYAPDGGVGFTGFNGTPINGVWNLWIGDDASFDVGYLSGWTIEFQNQQTYTYSWSASTGAAPANTSLTPSVCPAASTVYTLTATNSCGCTATASAAVSILTASSAGTNGSVAVCSNGTSINLFDYLGGSPVTTGTWTGPSGASISGGYLGTINPSSALSGVYTYSVSAPSCPTSTATVTVTINPVPTITFTGPTSICNGQTTNLTLSPSGALFSWTVSQSGVTGASNSSVSSTTIAQTLSLTNASPGTVTYTVFAAQNGCQSAPLAIPVSVASSTSVSGPSSSPTVCSNTALSPTITFTTVAASGIGTPTGLPPGVTAVWSGNTITLSGTPTAAGTFNYSIPITSSCGTATASGLITVTNGTATASVSVTSPVCSGQTSVLTFTGTPSATVNFTINGTSYSVTLNSSGNGTFTSPPLTATASVVLTFVQANGGCSTSLGATTTINVTNPTVPTFSAIGPFCYGVTPPALPNPSSNGVTGTWSPSAISTTNIGSTNYTFTPSGTCPAAPVTITVVVNERPIIYAHMVSNPTCTFLCNGVATVDVVGGTSPYTYAWSNGVTTATNSNLCAGTYTVTVTDANGCASQPFTPVAGCFQITSIQVDACNGGANNEGLYELVYFQTGTSPLTVTGGTASWPGTNPFTNFNCSNNALIAAVNATITGGGQLLPVPASGIIPANSNVVIMMSNTITLPASSFQNLSGPLYVMFHCASANGGYFANASTSPAGPRTTTLNFGSCTDQVTYNTGSLVNTNGTTGNTNQDGSTVLFSQSGTPTYVNYGCVAPYTTQSNSVTLTAPPPPTASISGSATICSGGSPSISFTGTPGAVITYKVNGGANQTITLDGTGNATLAAGTLTTTTVYSLVNVATTTTPACVQPLTGSATITVIAPPTASIGTSAAICFNTSSTINFTGTPNATVNYTINSGANQTIVLNASGTASLSTGNLTANTTYSLVSVATAGTPTCSASVTGTAVITIAPLPTASISGTTTICSGNSATISFSGTPNATVTYTVNGGSNQTIALNASGTAILGTPVLTSTTTYALVSVVSSGTPSCTATATGSAVITVNPNPTVNITGSSNICSGSTTAISLTSTPVGATFTYSINPIGVTGASAGSGSSINQTLSVSTPGVNGVVQYSVTGTLNGCPSIVNSVFVNVRAPGNAGTPGSINVCASGSAFNLFSSLGGSPQSTGTWTGPSVLGGGNLGTFTPGTSAAGTYTYTVTPSSPCPAVTSTVTVTVGSSPTATVSYAGPYCTSVTSAQSATIIGTTGGTYTASPTGLSISASGAITPSASTANTYTVTYTIPAANGCSAFTTTTNVVITSAPNIPTLAPTNPCANTATTFTAGNGESYEFFANGVSQGPSSATNTFNTSGLAAGTTVCVRNTPLVPFIMNGLINETQWGTPLATSAGGPNPSGFGGNNRIDALYMKNMKGSLYGAVAGNENDGADQANNNWIVVFIDSKPGGFNNLQAWTNRSNAPANTQGLKNLALYSNVVFDAGFTADYMLTMNQANATAYFDLYDMQTNTNNYLGSNVANPTQFGFAGNTAVGDYTRGFEFNFPLSLIGNPTYEIKLFAMMVNDPNSTDQTFLSNQFLTRANNGEGNYGNGFVDFSAAAPNPVSYFLNADCFQETCVTVQPQTTPTFNPIPAICYGASAPTLPTTSTNGISGTWSPAVSNTATATYTFTPTPPQCSSTTTTTVTVKPQVITNGINHN